MSHTLRDVKLLIPYDSYKQIMSYAHESPGEVTGFAEVEFDLDSYCFKMGKVYFLKQECTAADVEFDDDALDAFNDQMIEAGATQLPRLWWHSHNDFNVFFSPTDEGTIKYLAENSYVVALVVNKKKQMYAKARIMGEVPFEIEDIPCEVSWNDFEIDEAIKEEVKEKVTLKTFQLQKDNRRDHKKNDRPRSKSTWFPDYTMGFLPTYKDEAYRFALNEGLYRYDHPQLKCLVYKDDTNKIVYYDWYGLLDDYPEFDADPDWVKEMDKKDGAN